MSQSYNLPRCSNEVPFTDTSTPLRTVGDLRNLIAAIPDDEAIHFFGCPRDTVFSIEAEWKVQQCIEDNGKIHDVRGLIFQLD